MVINFVLPPIGDSGGINVVYKYAELLIERGHDVRVYKELRAPNMHRYNSKIVNSVHKTYCTAKALLSFKDNKKEVDYYVWKLSDKTIRDADAIIATAWPTAYSINKLSPQKGKKLYFIQDYEIWDNEEVVKKSYELPLDKVVISSWINQQLKDNLGIGPYPVVYNGIDKSIYHHINVNRCEGNIIFLMLNHTLPKKGVANGIEVFEKIREKYPESVLNMFGTCDNSNLPAYVKYCQNPKKEDLVRLYSEADIFIFPSLEEGWGLTPLEAMACGCLVVGTDTGFVKDIGIHKNNMMISEPGNINQMVQNIEELINNKALQKAVRIGMKNTINTLEWEKSANKLEELLSK